MGDWAKPTVSSNYVIFVDEMKARDIDAITLQKDPLTGSPASAPVGAVKLVRSPVKFQEWNGSAFVDLVLSPSGGGTGITNIANLPAAMGLGTMAYQNSNAVNITGGSYTNINSLGNMSHSGGQIQINQPANGHGLVSFGPPNATGYAGFFIGATYGIIIQSGTTAADAALLIRNAAVSRTGFIVTGDQQTRVLWRLSIPVGLNLWATA